MRKLAAAALFFAVACASSDDGAAPSAIPPRQAPDPRIGELQTQLTELLERIDVLNPRLARLEEPPVVAAAAPAPVITQPAIAPQQPRRVETAPPPVAPQRALVGAQIAGDYRNAIVL